MSAAKRICTREFQMLRLPQSFFTYDLADFAEDKMVEYEFVIKNFIATQSRLNKNVESPLFPQSDLPQWLIMVFPRGYDEEKFKFGVQLGLEKARPGKTTEVVDVKIRFLNDDRSVIEKDHSTCDALNHALFYDLRADSTEAIPLSDSGDLIINVEIILKGTEPIVVSQTGDDINAFPSTFSRDFSSALQSGILSDFTLISSDKREFPVHKVILAMRVPHFERMFRSGLDEVKQNRVEVKFSGDCVEALLDYVYTDQVVKLSGIVVELLQLAHQYEVDRLMSICAAEMVKNLRHEDLYESLRIADLYGIVSLQSACHTFIARYPRATAKAILQNGGVAKGVCVGETVPMPISFATYALPEAKKEKKIDYEFVVKNFVANQTRLVEFIESPSFPEKDLPQFCLVMYPRADGTEKFGVGVQLKKARLGKMSEVFALKFRFLNDNRSVIREYDITSKERPTCGGMYDRRKNHRLFYDFYADSIKAIPVSDSGDLIVNVEITMEEIPEPINTAPIIVSETANDTRIPNSTFSGAFSSALESGVLSDFTIISIDKREFPVHKIILAMRVPHLERMLKSDMAEMKKNRVDVKFSGDCVEGLLEYVYEDGGAKLSEIAFELLQLAHVYEMDRLVSICVAEIVKNLRQENVYESLRIADLYSIVPLQSACRKFIDDHPDATANAILQDDANNVGA